MRATTDLDYRARIVPLFSKLEILGVFFKLIHLIVVVAVAVAVVVVVVVIVVVAVAEAVAVAVAVVVNQITDLLSLLHSED